MTPEQLKRMQLNPTVCYKIFHHPFPVQIQNKFLISEKERQHRPVFNSYDEAENQLNRGEFVTVYRVLAGIVQLYDKGIPVLPTTRFSALTMYELLIAHLNNWADAIANPVSGLIPPPPAELFMMEAYSHFLYEDAMFAKDTLLATGKIREHGTAMEQFFNIFGGRKTLQQYSPDGSKPVGYIDPSTVGSNIGLIWDDIHTGN